MSWLFIVAVLCPGTEDTKHNFLISVKVRGAGRNSGQCQALVVYDALFDGVRTDNANFSSASLCVPSNCGESYKIQNALAVYIVLAGSIPLNCSDLK